MILAFSEDGGLKIHSSADDVPHQYDGFDVHCKVFAFYDDRGVFLKPVFDVPVTERRFLWFSRSIDSGTYHLEPDPSSAEDPLWVALVECTYLEPNGRFGSLDELKSFLHAQGVTVDPPQSKETGEREEA